MATVMRPLAARPDLNFDIAPFTVLVDPLRLAQPDQGAADYVYRKQLEEAELIGVTKLDAVDPRLGDATLHRLRQRFGPSRVLPLAAASGQGVAPWLDKVLAAKSELALRLDIDYAIYAAAEAALGWLNARGRRGGGCAVLAAELAGLPAADAGCGAAGAARGDRAREGAGDVRGKTSTRRASRRAARRCRGTCAGAKMRRTR